MFITRIPPTVAELVAQALSGTPYLTEITGAQPHQVTTYAEIAASLAAEQWEAEAAHHRPTGLTLPTELIAEAAAVLVSHASQLPKVKEADICAATSKIERALSSLATARSNIAGTLPLAPAEAFMDDIETHFDIVRIALTRARDILTAAPIGAV
jgi:hypothetical protein